MATWTGNWSPSVLMSISVAFLYPRAKIFPFFPYFFSFSLFFFLRAQKPFLLLAICFNFAKRVFKQHDGRKLRVKGSLNPGVPLAAANSSPWRWGRLSTASPQLGVTVAPVWLQPSSPPRQPWERSEAPLGAGLCILGKLWLSVSEQR